MKFHHPEAVAILKDHGVFIKNNVARFTEDQILHWIRKAPSYFNLFARNPENNIVIGKNHIEVAPPYGCPTVTEKNGTKRKGTIADYIKMAKLFQVNTDFHINGGLMVQPHNIDIPTSCLVMFYLALTHSDKIMLITAGKKEYMEAVMACAATLFGKKGALKEHPCLCTIVNTNSPLHLDATMTDVLLTFARNGQPFAATNGAMAGFTSPMTLAGTLAIANAEVLATIALTEMVNPGTPVIYGSQCTVADMKTGQMACGSAEGVICAKYISLLSDFYGLPSRGGGALTDAKLPDAQAGMESMMMLMTNYANNTNLIIHAAGILDSYLSISFEKMILDFEILRYIKRFSREIEMNDDTIPLNLIDEVGHEGEFLTKEHTLDHCRTEPLLRRIASCGKVANQLHQIDLNMEIEYRRLMDGYKKPEVDGTKLEEIKYILTEFDINRSLLNQIDTM
ncbi:MAG TPA: trimethylamine methyltransferase family protein [Clostridiales bacterium]|nr:trimethylamine methyltransferase family protein [Clostridiales bacterium]